MRIPFFSMFTRSPFDELQEHAEKVKECAWAFQQAIECYASEMCTVFEEHRQAMNNLEHAADDIKRSIRSHLPKNIMLPVEKFQLFRYLREQDSVIDAAQESLHWLSYRPHNGIPEDLQKDLFLFVDAVMEPIEELTRMVGEARIYLGNFSEKQREKVKKIISNIRQMEHEADQREQAFLRRLFEVESDPVTVFHMVRLAEIIGSIANHAENAGDMMRAMIAR